MRILHVSDIHCRLENLEEVLEREKDYDIVAITGDICCNSRLTRMLRSAPARILAVTGNMDDMHIARILRDNGWLLDGRIEVYGRYVFAGIGGLQAVQNIEALEKQLNSMDLKGKLLVVLAHHPVHGKLDRTYLGVHAGLYETRAFVEKYRPLVYMHGHIHEARGIDRLGETLLVNPGPLANGYYAVIEIDEDGARAELRRL